MGGAFGFTPQGPQVPPDIPEPSVPPPDFGSIAEQVLRKSQGWAQSIWSGLLSVIEELMGRALTVLYKSGAWLGLHWSAAIGAAEMRSSSEFAKLASDGISDLFGLDVQINPAAGAGGRAQRKGAARNAGAAVLQGLFTALGANSGSAVTPSLKPAEDMMDTMLQLALEGWLMGFTTEMVTLGAVESAGELDDIVAGALGLGRLSRRALHAPVDILVGKPADWLLNKTYRPELLPAAQAARQFVRGRWTRQQLEEELARQGYSSERIDAFINAQRRFLLDSDLDVLIAEGVWTREQAIQHLRDQGFQPADAEAMLRVNEVAQLRAFRRAFANEAASAFVTRDIDQVSFLRILDQSGLAQRERDQIRLLAGLRRELRTKEMTLSEVEQAVKRGILTLDDYRARLRKDNYSAADQTALELLLLAEVQDAEAARAAREKRAAELAAKAAKAAEKARQKEQDAAAVLETRQLSLSQVQQLVRSGIRSVSDYVAFLVGQGFSDQDAADLAGLLSGELDQRAADEARREELRQQAAVRHVSLSDFEQGVKRGVLTLDEYRGFLAQQGFADFDRELLARLLQEDINAAAAREEAKQRAAEQLKPRAVSLADFELAVRRGLRSVDDYQAMLIDQGFVEADAELLAGLLQQQLAADEAARARQADAESRAAERVIPLSDLARAVRAGVRSMNDYRALLSSLGFDETDSETLVSLLQLQIDSDKADAARKAAATATLKERNISLGAVERAVKLGVIDLAGYKSFLVRERFTAEDQQILVLSLLAELAQTREAERKQAEADAAGVQRGISLADLRTAVRQGLRSMAEYRFALVAAGFSAVDQETLVGLLQLQLDQDQSAQEVHGQVETQLAQRGLSLSQFERAVLEGIRAMAEYEQFLQEQGYDAESVATLAALLQGKLEARAAKESG